MHSFTKKIPFRNQISKRSTHTDLHHPPLHLAQFFSLESLKISSAYSKTSLGLKMEKILPDYILSCVIWFLIKSNGIYFCIFGQCRIYSIRINVLSQMHSIGLGTRGGGYSHRNAIRGCAAQMGRFLTKNPLTWVPFLVPKSLNRGPFFKIFWKFLKHSLFLEQNP